MYQLGLLVLLLVFAAALWGGLIVGPERLVPFLIFTSILLLPPHTTWELPGIPDLDKVTAITLPAVLLFFTTRRERWARFRTAWPDLFLYAFIAWGCFCVLLNQGLYAACARFLMLTTLLLVPWIAGRLYLTTSEDLRVLLKGCAPIMLVYVVLMASEAQSAPFLRDAMYGVWTARDFRFGLYRPVVFADNALELGHFLAMLAVVFYGAYRGWRGSGERVPRLLTLGMWAAVIGCLLSVSRGPVTGLLLGLVLPVFLRTTRWAAMAIGLAGLTMFLWMVGPYGSGTEMAQMFASSDDELGSFSQTLNYRFLQIDVFKPMVEAQPIIGYGEDWERTGDIGIIDGILLIYLLGYGYPGVFLIAAFWLSVIFYIGRQAWDGNSPYAFIGQRLAPVIGWLVFSAWGDSFLRHGHLLIMSAVVGAMYYEQKLARPLLPPMRRLAFTSG